MGGERVHRFLGACAERTVMVSKHSDYRNAEM